MKHIIKITEPYAEAIVDGRKNFEVRKNDRGYNAGDVIWFKVIYADGCQFTSHPLQDKKYKITYVHSGLGMEHEYVVFGIESISGKENHADSN